MEGLKNFCRGPRQHLLGLYSEPLVKIIQPLIFLSVWLFILEIIILASIPCSITLLNFGSLIAAYFAINGQPAWYQSPWYMAWIAVDAVFLVVTGIRGSQCHGSGVALGILCLFWAGSICAQVFLLHRLRTQGSISV